MSVLWLVASVPLGFGIGVLTGLFPGIHVNVVASLLVGMAVTLFGLGIPPLAIALFITAVAMTHAFFDIVPSLFLGVPADEVYALLPTQRLVAEGRGIEAMRLALYGSWRGLLMSVAFIAGFIILSAGGLDLLASFEELLSPALFWIMLIIAVALIATDQNRKWATAVFLVSGAFGVMIFATPLVPGGMDAAFNGLFPALSGLFGVSGLLLTLSERTGQLPPQRQLSDMNNGSYTQPALSGAVGGMIVGLLPGLGAANVATLMSLFTARKGAAQTEISQRQYIVTTSAINVGDSVFGIAALYFLNKTRSGASVAIGQLVKALSLSDLIAMVVVMVIVGWISQRALITGGVRLAEAMNRLSYKGLTLGVLGLIGTLVWQTTGLWGVLILIGTTLLGMVAPLTGVRRAQAMGMFLVPVMLYYSGYQAAVVSWLRLEAISLPTPAPDLSSLIAAMLLSVLVAAVMYLVGRYWSRKGTAHATPQDEPDKTQAR